MQVDDVKKGFIDIMIKLIEDKTDLYGDFIFGMIIATAIWLVYHRFVGIRTVKKSYELRLDEKDNTINALKTIVYERLENIEVKEITQKGFFGKIKKSFNVK